MLYGIFERKTFEGFEKKLMQNNPKNSLKKFFEESMAFSAIALLAGLAAALQLGLGDEALAAIAIAAFTIPAIAHCFFQLFLFEARKRRMEEAVPDALLQVASLPSGNDFPKTLKSLSGSEFANLGKEFSKALEEMSRGASAQEALDAIAERNCSRIVSRMCSLLKQGFESGADLSAVLRETAEDIIDTRNILKERSATLTVQKITLVFAGALIVPMVLGLLSGMVKDFDNGSIEELGVGLGKEQRVELQGAAQAATMLYIIEYAFIASFFTALIDNDLKKGALYSLFLVPCSLFAFIIAAGFL